jgi:hypothetical protein
MLHILSWETLVGYSGDSEMLEGTAAMQQALVSSLLVVSAGTEAGPPSLNTWPDTGETHPGFLVLESQVRTLCESSGKAAGG